MLSSNQRAQGLSWWQQVFSTEGWRERKGRSYLIAALLAAAPALAWSASVFLVSVKIFTKRNGFAEWKLMDFRVRLHHQRLDVTHMRSDPLMCYSTTVVSHFWPLHHIFFSVCGSAAREEAKTVNLLSKKVRRWAAKVNFSRSVVFGHRAEGERDTLLCPSISLYRSLHHLLVHVSLPSLFSLPPSTLDPWKAVVGWLQGAKCCGGVNPLNGFHNPVAPSTLILNLRLLCLAC